MDKLLLEALRPFGQEYDSLYNTYFQHPCQAKLVWALDCISEEKDPHKRHFRTEKFIDGFYSYLEQKSRKLQDPQQFLRFLGLVYRVHEWISEESNKPGFSPDTLTSSLDLGPAEVVVLHDQITQKTSFDSPLESYQLKEILEKDISYLIDVCTSDNRFNN